MSEVEPQSLTAALDAVFHWVDDLAALPPPNLKDEVGFSGSTDSPLRTYRAQVLHTRDAGEELPLDVHFAAVSYLREHSLTQIPRQDWERAFAAIRKAWREQIMANQPMRESTRKAIDHVVEVSKADAASAAVKEQARIDKAVAEGKKPRAKPTKDSRGGEVTPEELLARRVLKAGVTSLKNDMNEGLIEGVGSWRFDENRKTVTINTNLRHKHTVRKQMFVDRGVQVDIQRGEFAWIVPVSGIPVAADLFEAGWPELAQVLRMYAPLWSDITDEPLVDPSIPASQGSTGPGRPEAPAQQRSFEGTAEKGKSFGGAVWRWEWNPSDPETLFLLIPGKDASMGMPVTGMPVTGINAFRGQYPNVEYWRAYPTRELPAITEYAVRFSVGFGDAAAAFGPTWTHRPEASEEDTKRAQNLAARFQYMMHPTVRKDPDALEASLASVAGLLHRVQPGIRKVDLGAYGSFEVRWNEKDPQSSTVNLFTPYAWRDWSRGLRGMKAVYNGDKFGYWSAEIKRIPEIARRLDLYSPPLALALRIALLTENIRECYELEELAGATSVDQIADPKVRAAVEAILARSLVHMKLPLLPYQEVGVAFAELTNWRCMIGDAPGLGKTGQALAAMSANVEELTPALVVCPLSVTRNWVGEAQKFTDNLKGIIIDADTDLWKIKKGQFGVVTSSSLDRFYERLAERGFKCLILDESHWFKSEKAARTKAAMGLAESIPHILELTGTAMENVPEELWTQFNMIDPGMFPNFKEFKGKYGSSTSRQVNGVKFMDDRGLGMGGGRDDGHGDGLHGGEDDGEENHGGLSGAMLLVLAELRETLRCFMIRRMKHEVGTQIPEKRRQTIWIDLPPDLRKQYTRVEEQMREWMIASKQRNLLRQAITWLGHEENAPKGSEKLPRNREEWPNWVKTKGALAAMEAAVAVQNESVAEYDPDKAAALVAVGHLRRIVGLAKTQLGIEWILDFLETTQHRLPLLVVVEHQKSLKMLKEALDKAKIPWTFIDGSVTGDKRQQRVNEFQAGQYEVMVVTRAAAEGVTLTRAADGVFLERMWTPSKEEQLEDRLHRVTQKNPVLWRYFMASNTIDNRIHEIIDRKRALFEAILKGEGTEDELGALAKVDKKSTLGNILHLDFDASDVHIDVPMLRKAIAAKGVPNRDPDLDLSRDDDIIDALEETNDENDLEPRSHRRQDVIEASEIEAEVPKKVTVPQIQRAELEAFLLEQEDAIRAEFHMDAASLLSVIDDASFAQIQREVHARHGGGDHPAAERGVGEKKRAICPCCFEEYAVTSSGRMTRHGYKAPGRGSGYAPQQGGCPGSRFKPLADPHHVLSRDGVSLDGSLWILGQAEADLAEKETQIAQMVQGEIERLPLSVRGAGRYDESYVVQVTPEEFEARKPDATMSWGKLLNRVLRRTEEDATSIRSYIASTKRQLQHWRPDVEVG